jgi:hypothetical protein
MKHKKAQGVAGNTTGPIEHKPAELPPIFERMPRFRMNKEVRALEIGSATHEGDKIRLAFLDGYFPALEVPDWLSAPIEGQAVFMVDETGEQHIVPAHEFYQNFKRNT